MWECFLSPIFSTLTQCKKTRQEVQARQKVRVEQDKGIVILRLELKYFFGGMVNRNKMQCFIKITFSKYDM